MAKKIGNILGNLAFVGGVCALSACDGGSGPATAEPTDVSGIGAAADAGEIWCALNGAEQFTFDCSLAREASANGTVLVLGKVEGGFRRFRVVANGRGIAAADGAEPAKVTLIEDGLIEVAVANDRYRLPATVKPAS